MGLDLNDYLHTAIREETCCDRKKVGFLESEGYNQAANFSTKLINSMIYAIDVAVGKKIPYKDEPSTMSLSGERSIKSI